MTGPRWICVPPLLALLAAASAQTYRFEQIPTFHEPSNETLGLAFAINELGEVVGIADDVELIARGFLYRNGSVVEVPGFDPGTTSDVRAINQFGDVAGGAGKRVEFMGHPSIVTIPFVLRAGGFLSTPLVADELARGMGGYGFALNDSGVSVFEAGGPWIGYPDGRRQALQFDDVGGGTMVLVGDIDSRGRLVGTGLRPGSGFEAVAFNAYSGTTTLLHDAATANSSYADDINNNGVVVGHWQLLQNNRSVPVIWENGRARQLPFFNEDIGWIGRAKAINDRGDVVGESSDGAGGRIDWIVFAGTRKAIPLTQLADDDFFERFDDFMAFDINNSREIAGAAIATDPAAPLGSTNKPGILKPTAPPPPVRPAAGLWADVRRPGSGVELNRVGDRHYLIWYTYDTAGLPTWYFSDAVVLERDGWRADLLEFSGTGSGTLTYRVAGQAVLFNRSETRMLFSWRLGTRSGTESFQYLPGRCVDGALAHTGTWHDGGEPGFGLSLQQTDGGLAGVFYFYDGNGVARWAYFDFPPDPGQPADAWLYSGGACPGCASRSPVRATVGTAVLVPGASVIDLDVDIAGTGGPVRWRSTNRMVPLSSPATCP